MRNDITISTLSLLGGAAAGAIAMYLLDPETGANRRNQIAGSASKAVNDTAGSARSFASKVADYARDLSDQVSGRVTDSASAVASQTHSAVSRAKSQLADSAQALADKAQEIADQAHGHVSQAHDDLADKANMLFVRAKKSAYQQAGVEESHAYGNAVGITTGTIGVLALGAGLMYLFDPAKGRARRAWLQNKFFDTASLASQTAKKYGQQIGDKVNQASGQAQNAVPEEWTEAMHRATDAAVTAVTHHDASTPNQ